MCTSSLLSADLYILIVDVPAVASLGWILFLRLLCFSLSCALS